jgi:hypothetical protein
VCLTLQVDLYQPELLLHDHRLHMAEWEMMKVVAASCHCKRLCLPLQATLSAIASDLCDALPHACTYVFSCHKDPRLCHQTTAFKWLGMPCAAD